MGKDIDNFISSDEKIWIVTKVDNKISSISMNYKHFANIAGKIVSLPVKNISSIETYKISTKELLKLSQSLKYEDLNLFGSKFQKMVWENLWKLNHTDNNFDPKCRLRSYSEFAEMCNRNLGVRAVAHAVASNPVVFVIPCHLIIPKESIDKIKEIRQNAEKTLFKGQDLYLLDSVDVGKFAYGSDMKRKLVSIEFSLLQA